MIVSACVTLCDVILPALMTLPLTDEF